MTGPLVAMTAADLHALQAGGTVCGRGAAAIAGAALMLGKNAADFTDATPVDAEHVYLQLAANFPASAIQWVRRATWAGPVWVPWGRIDTDDEEKWAASHEPGRVAEFARQIKDHSGHVAPSVLVQEPDGGRAFIVDGHHRALARRRLGQRVLAYLGTISPRDRMAALETHSCQIHHGTDPANKLAQPGGTDSGIRSAGLAVRAAGTGRVLMQQRAVNGGDDPADGFWEIPGGRLNSGEDPLDAARREWAEETGLEVPAGTLTGIWDSSDGSYRGFVHTIPSEDVLDLSSRPAAGEGDFGAVLAWWDPGQIKGNPAVREELAHDHKRVRRALKSAQTPVLEVTPARIVAAGWPRRW